MSKTVVGLFDSYDYAETAARRIKEQGLRTDDISIVAKQSGKGGGETDADAGRVTGTGENPSMDEKAKMEGGVGADRDAGLGTDIGPISAAGTGTGAVPGASAGMGMGAIPGASAGMGGTGAVPDTGAKGDNDINDNISDGIISGGVLGGLAGLLIGAGSMVIPGLGIIAAAGPITGLLSGAVTGGIVGGLVDLGIPENKGKRYENDVRSGKVLFSMKTDEDKVDSVCSILRNNGATDVSVY